MASDRRSADRRRRRANTSGVRPGTERRGGGGRANGANAGAEEGVAQEHAGRGVEGGPAPEAGSGTRQAGRWGQGQLDVLGRGIVGRGVAWGEGTGGLLP